MFIEKEDVEINLVKLNVFNQIHAFKLDLNITIFCEKVPTGSHESQNEKLVQNIKRTDDIHTTHF